MIWHWLWVLAERICIATPVVFLLTMAFIWIVDRVFRATDTVLERVQRMELAAAERDLSDRLAVGVDEWIP